MPRSVKSLMGYELRAEDGDFGALNDPYFVYAGKVSNKGVVIVEGFLVEGEKSVLYDIMDNAETRLSDKGDIIAQKRAEQISRRARRVSLGMPQKQMDEAFGLTLQNLLIVSTKSRCILIRVGTYNGIITRQEK